MGGKGGAMRTPADLFCAFFLDQSKRAPCPSFVRMEARAHIHGRGRREDGRQGKEEGLRKRGSRRGNGAPMQCTRHPHVLLILSHPFSPLSPTFTHLLHFIPLCPSRLETCKEPWALEKGEGNTLDGRFQEENPPFHHIVASSHGFAAVVTAVRM